MAKTIYVSLAVAALLAVGKAAPFFPFKADMNCQQCIVSGYDYCITGTIDGSSPKP